jgi:hypothetical protein
MIDSRREGFGKVAAAKQDAGYDCCDRSIQPFRNQEALRMEGGKVKSGYEASSPFKV